MRFAIPCLLSLALASAAYAARLPFRQYTSADGLAQDSVSALAADGEGFLWVGTLGGLSRFDGDRFVGFGEADGLAGGAVRDLAVGSDGTYWVATDAGLFSLRPSEAAPPGHLFRRVPLAAVDERDRPFRLLAARDGSLWVGTHGALVRIPPGGDAARQERIDLDLTSRVQTLAEGPDGAVWVGTHANGIFRVNPDGRIDHLSPHVRGADFVRGFRFETDGKVWTSFFGGVAIFDPPIFSPEPRAVVLGHDEGMPIDTKGFVENGDGSVLVGSTLGLTELRRSGGAWTVGATIDRRSGLPGDNVERMTRDAAGNLWVGFISRGLAKRLEGGFTTLEDTNGPGAVVVQIASDREGHPLVVSFVGGKSITLARAELEAGRPIRVNLPPSVRYTGWGATRKVLQARDGSWWVGTGSGVFRYGGDPRAGVERLAAPPDARFTAADGLAGDEVFTLHEDPRGDLWISAEVLHPDSSSLSVFHPATKRIERVPLARVGTNALAQQFENGKDGSLWISFLDGSVVRVRAGVWERIAVPEELAGGLVRIFLDDSGKAWLLGKGPLYSAADSTFARFPTRLDVSRTEFWCAVEDRHARLWFASSRGLYRIDPASGDERRFTVEDGLVGNAVPICHRDGEGTLWFSDYAGLSRLDPGREVAPALAAARLREVRFAGEAVPIPSLGGTAAGPFEVAAGRGRVAIEYFAVHLGVGPPPRFQYRLEGADPDWSPPTAEHTVQYAGLSPGSYRFLVRTVDEEGSVHPTPAVVTFRILAPFWRRGWFLALAAAALVAAVHAAYRARLARVVALERVRTRIATDLHDDIGSSLSQIAILSQLARREIEAEDRSAPGALDRITELSGELVDTLGDVVWAINPQRDRMSDLVHRMRRFAGELFAESGATLRLDLPEGGGDEPLDADVRRQVYLVFKEALHNALRHSGARSVEVEMRREPGGLRLRVRDDGTGIRAEATASGHGLASMRRRAGAIGADLEIRSVPGEGTEIVLRAAERPANKPSRWIVGRPGGRP